MLTRLSLESARVLAEELKRRDVVVDVLPDSPLEKMKEAAETVVRDEPTTVEEAVESLAVYSTIIDDLHYNTHDNVMANIVDKVVELTDRRLTLARTVINPLIDKYADIMVDKIAKLVPTTPEINELEFGEFYDNPISREFFKGYGFTGNDKLETSGGINFNDENNYHINAMRTGNKVFDDKLRNILENRGDDWYKSVASDYFATGKELPLLPPSLSENYIEDADKNLVIHALAHYFYNRNDVLNQQSQSDYDNNLLKILGRTSQNLNGVFSYKDNLDNKELVTTTSVESRHNITVYGRNYRTFLERGGSPTAIMGHVRTKGPRFNINQLIENKAALESIYDKEMTNEIMELRTEKYRRIQQAAMSSLREIIDEIPESVVRMVPGILDNPTDADSVDIVKVLLERGEKFINMPKATNLDDVRSYARDIILVGLLPELEFSEFFRKMEHYLKEAVGVVNLTPAQACYYVVLDELVAFFLSQTSLSNRK